MKERSRYIKLKLLFAKVLMNLYAEKSFFFVIGVSLIVKWFYPNSSTTYLVKDEQQRQRFKRFIRNRLGINS